MLNLPFQNFDGKSAKQDHEMCPLRFECVPDVVPYVLALGNNRENRLTVKQRLAIFFDVVGVSVPHAIGCLSGLSSKFRRWRTRHGNDRRSQQVE
jgi:hypothetical protein